MNFRGIYECFSFEHSYQTLKIEYERNDVRYLEKTLTLEHKENEIRRQFVDEKNRMQFEIDLLKNDLFQIKLKDNEVFLPTKNPTDN